MRNLLGEVQEWFNWHAWKACVQETVPRVRISPSPLTQMIVHGSSHSLHKLSATSYELIGEVREWFPEGTPSEESAGL